MTRPALPLAARWPYWRYVAGTLVLLASLVAVEYLHVVSRSGYALSGLVAVRVAKRRDETAGDLWTLGADDFGAPSLRPLASRECPEPSLATR